MMKLERAINILETHNKWRRGSDEEVDYTVKELGIAIDLILKELKRIKKPAVSNNKAKESSEKAAVCDCGQWHSQEQYDKNKCQRCLKPIQKQTDL